MVAFARLPSLPRKVVTPDSDPGREPRNGGGKGTAALDPRWSLPSTTIGGGDDDGYGMRVAEVVAPAQAGVQTRRL